MGKREYKTWRHILCVLHAIINSVSEHIPTSPPHTLFNVILTDNALPRILRGIRVCVCACTHACLHILTGALLMNINRTGNKNSKITTVISSPWYHSRSLCKGPLASWGTFLTNCLTLKDNFSKDKISNKCQSLHILFLWRKAQWKWFDF